LFQTPGFKGNPNQLRPYFRKTVSVIGETGSLCDVPLSDPMAGILGVQVVIEGMKGIFNVGINVRHGLFDILKFLTCPAVTRVTDVVVVDDFKVVFFGSWVEKFLNGNCPVAYQIDPTGLPTLSTVIHRVTFFFQKP
jgi:hypothetical protein